VGWRDGVLCAESGCTEQPTQAACHRFAKKCDHYAIKYQDCWFVWIFVARRVPPEAASSGADHGGKSLIPDLRMKTGRFALRSAR